jgi:hypothetical protein
MKIDFLKNIDLKIKCIYSNPGVISKNENSNIKIHHQQIQFLNEFLPKTILLIVPLD